jgi:lipopolysaccharide transport system ATP-binding protein
VAEPRITVEDVSVTFPLYHGGARSLKRTVLAAASGRLGQDRKSRVVVNALRNVNFDLRGGDRLGLIGPNGSGKTTLLRVLGGIYEPAQGHVRVQGSLNALLDASLGMNMELTGRENIRLRGQYNGFSRPQLDRLEDDVADFAGLGDFIDLPVRIYSAGMVIRIGFALATAVHPQILLMDEWILAGDADFMVRAQNRLEAMVRGADILVLSTHDLATLQTWCSRVIWLDQGQIRLDGAPSWVVQEYVAAVSARQPVELAS